MRSNGFFQSAFGTVADPDVPAELYPGYTSSKAYFVLLMCKCQMSVSVREEQSSESICLIKAKSRPL